MDETAPVKKTRRKAQQQIQFPVEADLWSPGQKAPRRIQALWHRREGAGHTFGLPEFERPYMQRTLWVPDTSGIVIEMLEMGQQFTPAAPPPQSPTVFDPGLNPGGPGAVLRTMNVPQRPPGPLRGGISPSGEPRSEATDEAGNRIVLPAAFGMVPVG